MNCFRGPERWGPERGGPNVEGGGLMGADFHERLFRSSLGPRRGQSLATRQQLASSSPAAAMATPAWAAQAGFRQRNIFGGVAPRGPAMATLVRAICALGAVSLFTGITFAFDSDPTAHPTAHAGAQRP